MLKVGLTGGIASGKSVVAEMFAALGARVIQADQIAHQLMQPGQSVYKEVVHHFGAGILNADATVNRAKLAEAAFGGSRIQELNHIVHPAVLQRQEQWMNEIGQVEPQAIAIVEAALILEAGAARQFDRLIVVSCRPEQRIERWAKRVKVNEETARAEVTRRMSAQWPDADKLKAADYVIDNAGSLDETRTQVGKLFAELQTLANKGIDKV
jgi:dephospho-CoA kinase